MPERPADTVPEDSAVIFLNGRPPSRELIHRLVRENRLVIAADGAVDYLAEAGVPPDICCGDFDSVTDLDAMRGLLTGTEFIRLEDQDACDGEKALLLAHRRGARRVTFTGTRGERPDHDLANIAVLLEYHRAIVLSIVEDGSTARAVSGVVGRPGACDVEARAGDAISLIALGQPAHVTITGTKWELRQAALTLGTRGVSNVAKNGTVHVEVVGGPVVVYHLPLNPSPPPSRPDPSSGRC